MLTLEIWLFGASLFEKMGTIRLDDGSVLSVAWIAWVKSSMVMIVGMENMVSISNAGKLLNQSEHTSGSFQGRLSEEQILPSY